MLTKEQREIRQKGITGTDAAIIMGVSPWKTVHELVIAKKYPKDLPQESPEPWMEWGHLLEPVIADKYSEVTGQELIPSVTLQCMCHPWLRGTPDRLIVGKRKGMEIKTARSFVSREWGASGTDNVPYHYLLQVLHYMILTGVDEWDLAVLIDGCDFRVYHFFKDKELCQMLFEAERQFFLDFIAGDQKPAPEWNLAFVDFVKRRFPKDTKKKIVYEKDQRLSDDVSEALFNLRDKSMEHMKAEFDFECAKARVQDVIGEAGGLIWEDEGLKISWKKSVDRTKVDWQGVCEKLLAASTMTSEEKQILIATFSKTAVGSRRFLVTDPVTKEFQNKLLGAAEIEIEASLED